MPWAFLYMVLVPFSDDGHGDRGEESVEDLNRRWVHDILPHANVLHDVVSQMGYGCNIPLAYNANFDFVNGEPTAGDSDFDRSDDCGGYQMLEDDEGSSVEELSYAADEEELSEDRERSLTCLLFDQQIQVKPMDKLEERHRSLGWT